MGLGPAAKPAEPVMIDLLKITAADLDDDLSTYRVVTLALAKIGARRAMSLLKQHRNGKGLQGSEHQIRSAKVAADTAIRMLATSSDDK
jgi:hypothetical protein